MNGCLEEARSEHGVSVKRDYFETFDHETKTRPRQRGAEARNTKYRKVNTVKDRII